MDHAERGQKTVFHTWVLGYPDTENGDGEMVLQLRDQTTLSENLNLGPCTQVMQLTTL